MSQNDQLILDLSLKDLFWPILSEVKKEHKLPLGCETESYLLNILVTYSLSSALYLKPEKEPMLTERYLKALSLKEESKKHSLLKTLADSTLFKAGFFGESLKRKIIGLGFYKDIGQAAYLSLYSSTGSNLYADMHQSFSLYVDLLDLMGRKLGLKSTETDLISLLDRFSKAKSNLTEIEIQKAGLNLEDLKKASNQ